MALVFVFVCMFGKERFHSCFEPPRSVIYCDFGCVLFVLTTDLLYSPALAYPHYLIVKFYLQRLAAGEWFTSRVSACGLFHIAYPSAPEMLKTELRSIYSQLCQDDMPMVRRSAASNLGKFAATVESVHLKADILSIFEDLTQDGN
jgi:hypothetical protein